MLIASCKQLYENVFFKTSGNKIDREDREIPTHVGEDFAQRHGMYFLETSAKEAENVERLFMEIAAELMEVSKSCKSSCHSKSSCS